MYVRVLIDFDKILKSLYDIKTFFNSSAIYTESTNIFYLYASKNLYSTSAV